MTTTWRAAYLSNPAAITVTKLSIRYERISTADVSLVARHLPPRRGRVAALAVTRTTRTSVALTAQNAAADRTTLHSAIFHPSTFTRELAAEGDDEPPDDAQPYAAPR